MAFWEIKKKTMEDNNIQNEEDKELTIWSEVRTRILLPWKPFNWNFFGYLFGVIILIGGLGVWVSFYMAFKSPMDDGHTAAISLATFFIALWATSYLDINFLTDVENKIGFLLFNFLFFAFAIFLMWLVYELGSSNWSFLPASIGFLLSMIIWYVANADNEKFDEKTYNEKLRSESKKKHGNNW